MLLLIDSGNTRIKWAVVDPRQSAQIDAAAWLASGVILSTELADAAPAWRGLGIDAALVSHVAGAERRQQLAQMLSTGCGLAAAHIDWFASTAMAGGVRNGYRQASQLGCDRFASLIGARALFPAQHLIVATCGTATTIDALDADGLFLGGMILPGLGLMATSLAQQTAQLPQISDAFAAPPLFADQTDTAIRSGCLTAQAGAITLALDAHQGARCILSGGAARFVATVLAPPHHLIDNLVLLGLRAVSKSRTPC